MPNVNYVIEERKCAQDRTAERNIPSLLATTAAKGKSEKSHYVHHIEKVSKESVTVQMVFWKRFHWLAFRPNVCRKLTSRFVRNHNLLLFLRRLKKVILRSSKRREHPSILIELFHFEISDEKGSFLL